MDDDRCQMMGKLWAALEILRRSDAFAAMIPEVRSNMAYAIDGAKEPSDVLAVEGRITQSHGKVIIPQGVAFGASDHLARFLIEIGRTNPEIRVALDFAYNPELRVFLKDYANRKGWSHVEIDRSIEPEELRAGERRSIPWKVEELLRLSGGKVPKLASESGAIGKEPVSVILGSDPVLVAREMCELAEAYAMSSSPRPRIGKVDNELLARAVLRWQGASSNDVLVPPKAGVDAAVVDVGKDQVLIIAEDPIFMVPGLPLEVFGWAVVHIGASDVAVMGVAPRFMTYTLLLPPGTDEPTIERIARSVSDAASDLGITIVGGHTGAYPGIVAPMVGGVTVFSIADRNGFVTAAGAKPGDDLILTKGPAIEATAALAVLAKEALMRIHPRDLVEEAAGYWRRMTVVKDARVAMANGDVHAMHDATEGGVLGGIWEMAECSGCGVKVDESRIIMPAAVAMVCNHFQIDPLRSISEGSLLIACAASSSSRIITTLALEGIEAAVVGQFIEDPAIRVIRRSDDNFDEIGSPQEDPFWEKFFGALSSTQQR